MTPKLSKTLRFDLIEKGLGGSGHGGRRLTVADLRELVAESNRLGIPDVAELTLCTRDALGTAEKAWISWEVEA